MEIHIVESDSSDSIDSKYNCVCGKTYKDNSGLRKHKRVCKSTIPTNNDSRDELEQSRHTISQLENRLSRQVTKNKTIDEQLKSTEDKLKSRETELKIKDELIANLMGMFGKIPQTPILSSGGNNGIEPPTKHLRSHTYIDFLDKECSHAMTWREFYKTIDDITDEMIKNICNTGVERFLIDLMKSRLSKMDLHDRPLHCVTRTRKDIWYFKTDNGWIADDNIDTVVENYLHYLGTGLRMRMCKFIESHKRDMSVWDDKFERYYIENMAPHSIYEINDPIIGMIAQLNCNSFRLIRENLSKIVEFDLPPAK